MQFTLPTLAVLAVTALSSPLAPRQAGICASGSPQCCATDVLNLLILDCAVPSTTPTDNNAFIDGCAEQGQQAKCCLLPILGQALICSDVNPTAAADPQAKADEMGVETKEIGA